MIDLEVSEGEAEAGNDMGWAGVGWGGLTVGPVWQEAQQECIDGVEPSM